MVKLSLRQILGQFLVIGYKTLHPPDIVFELIREQLIGGIILFKRNITSLQELKTLTQTLVKAAPDPTFAPYFTIDQEWGIVSRLPAHEVQLPGAMAMGAVRDQKLIDEVSKYTGRLLKYCGIQVNYAPVLDLATMPRNPQIGTRAFGSDPLAVAAIAKRWIQASLSESHILCAKHFPGIGDALIDTHIDGTTIPHTEQTLWSRELIPFIAAFEHGVPITMISHTHFPALDPGIERPATLSPKIVKDFLIRKCQFEGLIVSDDLEMGAVLKHYSLPEACFQALQAGIHVLPICHSPEMVEEILDYLEERVNSNLLPLSSIENSFRKIQQFRNRISGHNVMPETLETLKGKLNGLAYQIAQQSITLWPKDFVLPAFTDYRVEIHFPARLTDNHQEPSTAEVPLLQNLVEAGLNIKTVFYKGDTIIKNEVFHPEEETYGDITLICTHNVFLHNKEKKYCLNLMERRSDCIIAALGIPSDLEIFERARFKLATYSSSMASMETLSEIFLKKRVPYGRCPVEINA